MCLEQAVGVGTALTCFFLSWRWAAAKPARGFPAQACQSPGCVFSTGYVWRPLSLEDFRQKKPDHNMETYTEHPVQRGGWWCWWLTSLLTKLPGAVCARGHEVLQFGKPHPHA